MSELHTSKIHSIVSTGSIPGRVPIKRLLSPSQPRPLDKRVSTAGITRRWQHDHGKLVPLSPRVPNQPPEIQHEIQREALTFQLQFSEAFTFIDGVARLEVRTHAHPLFPGIPCSVTPHELATIVRAYLGHTRTSPHYGQAIRYPRHTVVLLVAIPDGRSVSAAQFQRTPRVEVRTDDGGQSVTLKTLLHENDSVL